MANDLWYKTTGSFIPNKNIWNNYGSTPVAAPTPAIAGMPQVFHDIGAPQIAPSALMETNARYRNDAKARVAGESTSGANNAGQISQPQGYNFIDPYGMTGGGSTGGGYSGGGGGISAAQQAYDNMRKEMQRLADAERGGIETRRDTLLGETEAGYGDQVKYLDTQEQNIRAQAESGRGKIKGQQEQVLTAAQQDAELASKVARDTYRDLIIQGRRRARATGAGGSSGYIEVTGMLDKQLMTGLGQVEQTKQNKVMTANKIAEQAVADIELSLNEVLGELNNNRAMSLRERDKAANEIRMNAADALLEVDKWVTNQFADIDTAKASLRASGGGSRSSGSSASYNKQNYDQATRTNLAQIYGQMNNEAMQLMASGKYTPEAARALVMQNLPNMITYGGVNPSWSMTQGSYLPGFKPEEDEDMWY